MAMVVMRKHKKSYKGISVKGIEINHLEPVANFFYRKKKYDSASSFYFNCLVKLNQKHDFKTSKRQFMSQAESHIQFTFPKAHRSSGSLAG